MDNNTPDNRIYELQKDYEHPFGKTHKGTVGNYDYWKYTFPKLQREDLDIKDDWFKEKQQPVVSSKGEIDALIELKQEFVKMRNEAHINCLDEFKNAMNQVIVITENKIKSCISEYLNGGDTIFEGGNKSNNYYRERQIDIPTLAHQDNWAIKEVQKLFNPEDKVQDKEVGWEIQAYRNKERNTFFNRSQWGDYDFNLVPEKYGDKVEIHSVKRLSDNTVFTIGDNVTYNPVRKFSWVIDNFFITSYGVMAVRSKDNGNVEFMNDNLEKLSQPLPLPEKEETKFKPTDVIGCYFHFGRVDEEYIQKWIKLNKQ